MILGGEGPDKSLNGAVEQASGDEQEHEEEVEDSQFYDKEKSFFDSISCDSTERARGYVKHYPKWY